MAASGDRPLPNIQATTKVGGAGACPLSPAPCRRAAYSKPLAQWTEVFGRADEAFAQDLEPTVASSTQLQQRTASHGPQAKEHASRSSVSHLPHDHLTAWLLPSVGSSPLSGLMAELNEISTTWTRLQEHKRRTRGELHKLSLACL